MNEQNTGCSVEQPLAQTPSRRSKLIGDDGMFSRWLLATLELLACGILMLCGTVEVRHPWSAAVVEGGIGEWVSVRTLLEWITPDWVSAYDVLLVGYFAAAVAMAIPLFCNKFRLIRVLSVMLAVSVVFTVVNATALWLLIDIVSQTSYGGALYESSLTEIGMIYAIVSVFALVELVLAIASLAKKRRQAAVSEEVEAPNDKNNEKESRYECKTSHRADN